MEAARNKLVDLGIPEDARNKWVLTVPVKETPAARLALRTVMSDLINDNETLHFISEPVAALINFFSNSTPEKKAIKGPEKQATVMVIDFGGGTVDMTIYQLERPGEDRWSVRQVNKKDRGLQEAGERLTERICNFVWRTLEQQASPDIRSEHKGLEEGVTEQRECE